MHPHDEHWDHRMHRAWRKMEAMGRRGWGGPGRGGGWGNWGDWGGFGDSFRIGRMMAAGDLRLVALYFIEQQPRHGYDLIKAIEDRTSGIYSPSPGVVYPALTFLEEAGYVTSSAEGNKRLYTITDEGRAHLAENRDAVESALSHLRIIGERVSQLRARWQEAQEANDRPSEDRDIADVPPEVNEARRELKLAIREAVRSGDPGAQHRLADILRRAAADIRRDTAPGNDDIDI